MKIVLKNLTVQEPAYKKRKLKDHEDKQIYNIDENQNLSVLKNNSFENCTSFNNYVFNIPVCKCEDKKENYI